jgi:hypothetical protein
MASAGTPPAAHHGYYHGLGVSGRMRAELTGPYVSVGAELLAGRYRPHDGRDLRWREQTIEQRIASRFIDYDLWLRGALHGSWFLEARAEGSHRWERFEELEASARLLRAGFDIRAVF